MTFVSEQIVHIEQKSDADEKTLLSMHVTYDFKAFVSCAAVIAN